MGNHGSKRSGTAAASEDRATRPELRSAPPVDDGLQTVDVSVTAIATPHVAPGPADQAYLIVLSGSNTGEMHKLDGTDTVIGRTSAAQVRVFDDGASRKHALLKIRENGEVVIRDLESRNGTYVNGEPIDVRVLRDGDKIQIGSTTILKFTYSDDLDESFQRKMYESALRDGLTKAFNRKSFLDRLKVEFHFAKRHGSPLALIMLDIDHFKRINDTHGHLAGDTILSELCRRLQRIIRHEDTLARYGGEEFAVICRAIEHSNCITFAERIRRTIEGAPFIHEELSIPVTISVGVATFPEVHVEAPNDLIEAADQAMYEAKRGGRNRVCSRP